MMNIEEIQDKVESLKTKITKAEKAIAESEGRKKELMKQLKTEFDIATIKEAKSKLSKLEQEIEDTEKEIQSKYNTIKESELVN